MYQITDSELQIIQKGLSAPENLNYFTDYWFDRGDGTGFRFDKGFKIPWQYQLIFAKQSLIVAIQGIGTGKSLGTGMAAFTWAMSTEGFKFMNGANWAYQSKLMWELVIQQLTDTPAYKFIDTANETPYPKIILKYGVGRSRYQSSLEFMSMDKNAKKIFSWRGDWINLDEAALIDDLDLVLMNLATRLTGSTPRGREYLARMSMMSNAWDNDSATHLYQFYDMALSDPENCLAISVPTSNNPAVSKRQVNNALKFIPKDEQDRMLEGIRPQGKGLYFPKQGIALCKDKYMSETLLQNTKRGEIGWYSLQVPTFGIVQYEIPSNSNYKILIGDPGTADLPARNAPVWGVMDVEGYPQVPIRLIAFWWGAGMGSISPFVNKGMELQNKYRPFFTGVDSTGPQMGMVQSLNIQRYWTQVYNIPGLSFGKEVIGLDFSSARKGFYLLALRILIESGMLKYPEEAYGISSQLANYDPAKDRVGEPKIAQDIVSCLSMGAHVARAYFGFSDDGSDPSKDSGDTDGDSITDRWTRARYDSSTRNQRIDEIAKIRQIRNEELE